MMATKPRDKLTAMFGTMKSHQAFLFSLLILIFLSLGTMADATSLKLSWNPNTEPDLAEYGVYVGDQLGGPYTLVGKAIAPQPGQPIPAEYLFNVPEGTDRIWHFVVDAADAAGNRSGYSNEVASNRMDLLPPVPPGGLKVIRLAPGEGAVIIIPPSN